MKDLIAGILCAQSLYGSKMRKEVLGLLKDLSRIIKGQSMTKSQDLGSRMFNIKTRWMRSLNHLDQRYFESKLTLKHLSLFKLNVLRKNRNYLHSEDLEKELAIYLMMIMVMNSVSDEKSLLNEFEKYAHVPTYLLKLAEGVNPYRIEIDFFEISKKIGMKLHLAEIYNKACKIQEDKLKKEIFKDDYDTFTDILDYYAFETLGFALIEKQTVKEFNYEDELAGTFKYINDKYYKNLKGRTEDEKKYARIMKEFIERRRLKSYSKKVS